MHFWAVSDQSLIEASADPVSSWLWESVVFHDESMDRLHIFHPRRSVSRGYCLYAPQVWRSVYPTVDPKF